MIRVSIAEDATGQGRAGRRLSLSTFLPYRLNVVAAVVSEGLARRYGHRFGITIPEWRILATLGEAGSVTATAIALQTHMGKVKVSRAAASLEARGLIRRNSNPQDMREAFLLFTPAGEAVYNDIVPLALDYVGQLTGRLSEAEKTALDETMDALLRSARDMAGSLDDTQDGRGS